MKTLHYRRHSLKDGANDTIGPKGASLAISEGNKATSTMKRPNPEDGPDCGWIWERYARIFHGPLIRTLQTAYHFAWGLGYVPTLMPIVTELGNDDFKAAYKETGNYLQATRRAHGDERANAFALQALKGVRRMFDSMEEGEIAVAFGHSPIIDLVAWATTRSSETPLSFAELEGILLIEDDGRISLAGTIRVDRS